MRVLLSLGLTLLLAPLVVVACALTVLAVPLLVAAALCWAAAEDVYQAIEDGP